MMHVLLSMHSSWRDLFPPKQFSFDSFELLRHALTPHFLTLGSDGIAFCALHHDGLLHAVINNTLIQTCVTGLKRALEFTQ